MRSRPFKNESSPSKKFVGSLLEANDLSALPLHVVIMAGGRGERLRPLTEHMPKPLLNVGNRPLLEHMVMRLRKLGIKYITLCVNYMSERFVEHFGDGSRYGAHIDYIFESDPLGTIGGISLKDSYKFGDILVINGDILTTLHFDHLFRFYLQENADLTIASIPYSVNLPYGILDLDAIQNVKSIREKPVYTYYINAGIYLMKRELISGISQSERLDAVELISQSVEQGLKVNSFPVLDYWIDIGQMEDYQKAQKDIHFLEL